MAQNNNQNNLIVGISSLIASLSFGGTALAVSQGNALATLGFSSLGGAAISTVLSKKQDNSILEEDLKELKNQLINIKSEGELEKNILELKTEIKDLNSKVGQPDAEVIKAIANLQELLVDVNEKIINIKRGENRSVNPISTSTKPVIKPRTTVINQEENINILNWLKSRNIEVNAHGKPHTLDESKYKIAVFLGKHYQVLEQLYDLIKINMKKKINHEINGNSSFPFGKLPENKSDIDICVKFCEILYEAGFLVSPSPQLNTNKLGQIFLNIKTAKNEVMSNFISGMWFEYFIEQKIIMFLKENHQKFECIKNVKVTLSNDSNISQNNELDLLFLVGEKLIWIECKSGNNYDQFLRKYSDLRKLLKFNIQTSFVVILDEEAKLDELSEWWKLTVVNPHNLLEKIANILNIPFKGEKIALSGEEKDDLVKEFNEMGFRVNDPKQQEKIDEEKRAIALFLAVNYHIVKEFYKLVKEHIWKKITGKIDVNSTLPFNKLPDDHDQIKIYLELSQILYQGKYLTESPSTEIKQNNAGQNYIVVKTAKNEDYEFLERNWFKCFVEDQICKFLQKNNKEFIYLKKEDGENNVTDLLFLINNHVISVKCKIGNQDNNKVLNDYYIFGKKIKCPAEKLFLVIFEEEKTEDVQKSVLKYKNKVTVVNQTNLINKIEVLLNLLGEESPHEVINQNTNTIEVINPTPLYTLFNHRFYRPCPENRQDVIKELIIMFENIEQPVTMNYVKLQLVEKLGLSQSKLKEILKAIIDSHCLLNVNGDVVNSFSESVNSLVSQDVQELDNRCIQLYKEIVLSSHPNYFDSEENIKLFEETVGGKLVNS